MVRQYHNHSLEILTSEDTDFKHGSKGPRGSGGNGIISLPGHTSIYDLRRGFPNITTKPGLMPWVVKENLWFISGDTNIRPLELQGVDIWRRDTFHRNLEAMAREGFFEEADGEKYTTRWEDALKKYGELIKTDEEFAQRFGDAGPIYGRQWRRWPHFDQRTGKVVEIDQLGNMINKLKRKPTTKRAIVSSWNPGEVPDMSLPVCHVLFHATANEDGEMDLMMTQRSCDQFLGVPFNIAGYALMTHLIAKEAGLTPRRFVHHFDDAHFYTGFGIRSPWYANKDNLNELKRRVAAVGDDRKQYTDVKDWLESQVPRDEMEERYDQVPAILEQLAREPLPLPTLEIADKPMDELKPKDIKLRGYKHYDEIKRLMVV